MSKITLYPGEQLQIEFAATDGQFEVHFATDEHPNALVLKETAGIAGNKIGHAFSIIYHDDFDSDNVAEVAEEQKEKPVGFFMDACGKIQCTEFVHCRIVPANLNTVSGDLAYPNEIVETLNSEDEVTGEFTLYRTLHELESVSGTTLAKKILI